MSSRSNYSHGFTYNRDTNDEQDDKAAASAFHWRKKNEKMGIDKLDQDELDKINQTKKEEAKKELEKLKKRKIEREREREEREREREFLQRQKEAEYHKEWEKQEDSFHLQQVKLRSKIRIQEARAKPIDLLAKYINDDEDDDDDNMVVDMREPYTYLNGLTIRDLEDLLVDIKVYADLEKEKNADYWKDMSIIVKDELKKLQRLDSNASKDHMADRQEGINQAVIEDVSGLFKGKTYQQLIALEESINKKIKNESGIDIGYWESVLYQLKANMARARLRERHKVYLVSKLQRLKAQQGIQQNVLPVSTDIKESEKKLKTKSNETKNDRPKPELKEEKDDVDLNELCIKAYESGRYSPSLLNFDEISIDTLTTTQDEDNRRLEYKRMQILGNNSMKLVDSEEEFAKKAREAMDLDDTATKHENTKEPDNGEFNNEIPVEHQYLWSDKYRPRKPRYYNRVHTGYDWNQYNKKHYDSDNPPPKTVQGYKFNIFYPDLIDKTQTPTYSITPCQDNRDFAMIRFHAGPPYEDIAFKIVNREWDISNRHGFRNQFQNSVFQLWFHFRKWKYRR